MSAGRSAPAATRRFKPYPAYEDSGVESLGEIPAHWELRLGAVGLCACSSNLSAYAGPTPHKSRFVSFSPCKSSTSTWLRRA